MPSKLHFEAGYEAGVKETMARVKLYFHTCWIAKKVPKLEELEKYLEAKNEKAK